MAGYIGTKAVNLSTTGADIAGDADIGGDLTVDTNTLYVDSTNNRVGVGTSSPASLVHLESDTPVITLRDTSAYSAGTGPYIQFQGLDSGSTNRVFGQIYGLSNGSNSGQLAFYTRNSGSTAERMRLDASGNLLVGTTAATVPSDGAVLATQGGNSHSFGRDGKATVIFNRATSDGDIAVFRKDNSSKGSIGNSGNYMYLASLGPSARGVKITDNFIPATTSGANNDNVMDLGGASVRWDDVYATNGTIQTSDRNEKQDIAELSDAEQRVSVAAKGLMRKFRWRDAVEEKGEEARTHFGIIAQDLQAAFVAEGLDAGDYAMFISTTWWETQTEVPAVEAVAEVLDEDGNVITEAVEAADAYTRTDTYETQEEAPEGATERTRLGVRYSELLAFIVGAL